MCRYVYIYEYVSGVCLWVSVCCCLVGEKAMSFFFVYNDNIDSVKIISSVL